METALDDLLLPRPLRGWLEKGRCVAFVGAGFSMPLGFPSWQGLMENLLKYAKEHSQSSDKANVLAEAERQISKGQIVEAAGKLKHLLTKSEFSVFLNKQFSTRCREALAPVEAKERMRTRLQSLINTPWAGIVTTNYDDYIRADGFDWRANGTDPDLGHILSRQEPFLVKLHSGNWLSDVVLTSVDYYETYLSNGRSPGVVQFLKALMLTHYVVFIGSSLENRLLDVRRDLHQTFKGYLPNAWALVPATQDNLDRRDAMLKENDIKLITYPTDIASQPPHWCVDRFLELAAQSRKP